jgi:hypothetical protein
MKNRNSFPSPSARRRMKNAKSFPSPSQGEGCPQGQGEVIFCLLLKYRIVKLFTLKSICRVRYKRNVLTHHKLGRCVTLRDNTPYSFI